MTIGEPTNAVIALTGSTVVLPGTCEIISQANMSKAPTSTTAGTKSL